jgi:hypothetical protein
LRICLRTAISSGGDGLGAIIDAVAPLTEGFSGAQIKQLCDTAKRTAMKRTGFTEVAAPTVADVLAALKVERQREKGNTHG